MLDRLFRRRVIHVREEWMDADSGWPAGSGPVLVFGPRVGFGIKRCEMGDREYMWRDPYHRDNDWKREDVTHWRWLYYPPRTA